MDEDEKKKARIKRAVIKGAIMEIPILIAGAFYVIATGAYEDPMIIVALVVLASAAGMGAAALAYVRDKPR